tara:strand:+ start:110 stop:352 length:243 start_codon:yes stop_codon:yes gene_type:complete
MKLTKRQLKALIKEEVTGLLEEEAGLEIEKINVAKTALYNALPVVKRFGSDKEEAVLDLIDELKAIIQNLDPETQGIPEL